VDDKFKIVRMNPRQDSLITIINTLDRYPEIIDFIDMSWNFSSDGMLDKISEETPEVGIRLFRLEELEEDDVYYNRNIKVSTDILLKGYSRSSYKLELCSYSNQDGVTIHMVFRRFVIVVAFHSSDLAIMLWNNLLTTVKTIDYRSSTLVDLLETMADRISSKKEDKEKMIELKFSDYAVFWLLGTVLLLFVIDGLSGNTGTMWFFIVKGFVLSGWTSYIFNKWVGR